MTIKELLNELSEFSPELAIGHENNPVDRLVDCWQSYYDEAAIFVCDDLPLYMPAFKNSGTLVVTEDLMSFIPFLAMNVIVIHPRDMAAVKARLEMLLY